MPPKRTTSGSKRKAESPEISDLSDTSEPVKAKKAKTSKKERVDNGQPTGLVLPVTIYFPPRVDGTLRFSTWNVSGLNASLKKGFESYVKAENADILVLTETKVNEKPGFLLKDIYPHQYWSISSTKGYGGIFCAPLNNILTGDLAGTAILCKKEPQNVKFDFPTHEDGNEASKGRIIALEYPNTWLIGTYVPNAGQALKNIGYKATWNDAFAKYIHKLNAEKPVIWMGDINCARTPLDLANSKSNWNKTPGHTQVETDGLNKILEGLSDVTSDSKPAKLVDAWRHFHPDLAHYTYFSYKFQCRSKQLGWRLDTFLVNETLLPRVKLCEIRDEIWGASDHCPVVLEIEGDL